MHQMYAGPLVQHLADERATAVAPDRLRAAAAGVSSAHFDVWFADHSSAARPRDRASELEIAERLIRRSLALEPTLWEAHIRLAEVLGDEGNHREARDRLQKVTKSTLPSFLDYYASLLTGREAERLGEQPLARAAFERARRLYPRAETPRLGLSYLAATRGDWSSAQRALNTTESADPSASDGDPWFLRHRLHSPSAAELLRTLRQAFLR